MSRWYLLLWVSFMCLCLSGCKTQDNRSKFGDEGQITNALNDFGLQLVNKMIELNGIERNVVISPAAITGVLAMVLLGSVGDTYDELANALGFTDDILVNRARHETFGSLLRTLTVNGSATQYADAACVDRHIKLRALYQSFVQAVYDGDVLPCDFQNATANTQLINDWVSRHTLGRIPAFLPQPLPSDSRVVLLSALAFRGQWRRPFLPATTTRMPFKKSHSTVLVDMMLNSGNFSYVHSLQDGLHMIALPYNDSTTTMYIIKPNRPEHLTLSELLKRLNHTVIDDLIKLMEGQAVVLTFPKMDIKSSEDLKPTLRSLGIKSMFTPGKANFALMVEDVGTWVAKNEEIISRIDKGEAGARELKERVNDLPNPQIHVDAVKHDVQIKIDEFGTEAVAVTAGILERTAKMFHSDSPFYMFIRDERTKLITFSAAIFDPTLS